MPFRLKLHCTLLMSSVVVLGACSPAPAQPETQSGAALPSNVRALRTDSTAPVAALPPEINEPELSPTPEADPGADPAEVEMQGFVQALADSGALTRAEGTYTSLADLETSWAQLNYYDWLPTGATATDFVLRASLEWESADGPVNRWNSGCGFVFRANARGEHYLALLASDGFATLYRNAAGTLTPLGRWNYQGGTAVAEQGLLTLLAEGDRITTLVDGRELGAAFDETLPGGRIGYAIASGTNSGFGTRCLIRDVGLWTLK